MSRIPDDVDPLELTVVARRILLDALDALQPHRDGITIVGAQAVYLRSEGIDLAVAGSTRDADLALTPELVEHPPEIAELMRGIGFRIEDPSLPGTWTRNERVGQTTVDIPVDLLVPEKFAGKGRRSASIPPHDRDTARRIPGLEAVLYDRDVMAVASLDRQRDMRVVQVNVAGVAALLIAKTHKIQDRFDDRLTRPDRLADKDAADVVRLFMSSDPEDIRERWDLLARHDDIAPTVARGRALLHEQFGGRRAPGVELAEQSLQGADVPIADLAVAWVDAFIGLD